MPKITRSELPTVAENRIWNIVHNSKSMAKPVTIELREYHSKAAQERNLVSHARLLGFITTTAAREEIVKAAVTLYDRVNDIDDVVGTY